MIHEKKRSTWCVCLFFLKLFTFSLIQERSDVARKIIASVRKKRGEMIRGIERLCDAYITLAYMDASRHKTEKSELYSLATLLGAPC